MVRPVALRILALATLWLALPAMAAATLYSYVDERGIRHFTNVPADSRARPIRPGQTWVRPRVAVKRLVVRQRSYRPATAPARRNVDIEQTIRRVCREHRVDPLLIKAIIKTESNFNPRALSPHGAQGLMQLMPETARDLQVDDPFDPYQNIYAGTRYFRRLLETYRGDIRLSLAAYNAGPGRVRPFGSLPRIPETRRYVRKVLRHYRAYRRNSLPETRINLRQLVTVN